MTYQPVGKGTFRDAAASCTRAPPVSETGMPLSPAAFALLAALLLMALAPIGYVGGGWDDRHYLAAARCAALEGFCLPGDHWARRFTLVGPTGLVLALFGESRQALWLVPAGYSLAAVTFFTLTVQRCYGHRTAFIAGFLFAVMPVFSERMLDLGVDTAELAFVCGAAYCLGRSATERRSGWVVTAGLLLGLAVLTRPTSLALLPVGVAALVMLGRSRQIAAFLAAFVLCIATEALVYGWWAGDPLLGWRVSLAHTTIPSTELASAVDLTRSPLFNVEFIDNWRPASGIALHWTVDALLNLLANGTVMVLPLALALLVVHRKDLGGADAGGAGLIFLAGGAMLYFGALVYGFAIDPKPRMFLPVAGVACVVIGVLGSLAWEQGRRHLVIGLLGILGCQAAVHALVRSGGDPIGAAVRPLPAG